MEIEVYMVFRKSVRSNLNFKLQLHYSNVPRNQFPVFEAGTS